MNMMVQILTAIAAAIISGVYATAGVADEALPPELIACTNERDVMRRLSCFDSVMAVLLTESAGEEPASASAMPKPEPASAPPPQATAVAAEALAPAAAHEPDPAPGPVPDSEPPRMAVTPAAEIPGGEESPARETSYESPPAEPVSVPAAEPPGVASAASGRRENSVFVPDEFTATVTNIRKRPYGELIILLSNGQIWEQKHLDRRFRLAIGDKVTISKGKVSGYRLRGRGNNSIQVERLQ